MRVCVNFDSYGSELKLCAQALVANEEFQHILRVLNTNVDGKQKIMFALTSIKGIGRRLANIVCKKADVDMNKRSLSLSLCRLKFLNFRKMNIRMTIKKVLVKLNSSNFDVWVVLL